MKIKSICVTDNWGVYFLLSCSKEMNGLMERLPERKKVNPQIQNQNDFWDQEIMLETHTLPDPWAFRMNSWILGIIIFEKKEEETVTAKRLNDNPWDRTAWAIYFSLREHEEDRCTLHYPQVGIIIFSSISSPIE